MHSYHCDYPGCDYSEESAGHGGTKEMVHITVTVGNTRKNFHVCKDHAKAIGLDTDKSYSQDINTTLLEALAEFVADVVEEVQQQ